MAYGIGLSSRGTPYAPVAAAAALAMDGEVKGGATLLFNGTQSTIGGACLANSALFHGRAQEDTCGAAHFGTVLVPLLTALVEAKGLPLDDLLPALIAGYEAGGLVEQALGPVTTPAGFRSTAVYGTISAAASAARLLNLSPAQTASALRNAVSFSGGVLQSFVDATDEWRYQPGIVARNGWVAAELAAAGSVTAPRAFEGKSGLARAFAGVDIDASTLASRLGRDWSMRRVTFKPFPVCAFNQTPVTAALALRARIDVASIQRVRVRMNPFETGYAGMDARGPFSSISGTLMSIPFCVAASLIYGAPSYARMTQFDDADLNAFETRVELLADPDVPTLTTILEVDVGGDVTVVQEQRMTELDYQYDRSAALTLLCRIGSEQGIASSSYDRINAFVDEMSGSQVTEIAEIFSGS
ncbi:MAG: MmgE/PrpD family protein [Sphingobium sp.]|nr:MmgE/PrpD family protein [Sphingobium sp.]MBP8670594.1 MmgE/PrpD family protein [Sphingobium sp.]MBP9157609.1 MmgE/PrpD family protein [Sphingobium sp.]